uniref:Regulator of G-protein signaling rgs-3 n=2 Tax=Toxocara canis TaxID=6265 RepID=A0A183VA95_TOXCA
LFRVFLHENLADETLSFLEAVEQFKAMKDAKAKRKFVESFFEDYQPYLNIGAKALKKVKEAIQASDPDSSIFDQAVKEVEQMLENDQFPRFKRSNLYMHYLEQLTSHSIALTWKNGINQLLCHQVGKHYFRLFLQRIRCEEKLRFLEAASEFSLMDATTKALVYRGTQIFKQFILEGADEEVFLPFEVRNLIQEKLMQGRVDANLFEEAIRYVATILKNDAYIRFLQSDEYRDLLARLK